MHELHSLPPFYRVSSLKLPSRARPLTLLSLPVELVSEIFSFIPGSPSSFRSIWALLFTCRATSQLILPALYTHAALIEGPLPHDRCPERRTILHRATAANHISFLRMLLRHGAGRTINIRDGSGMTAVQTAVVLDHKEALRLLLRVPGVDLGIGLYAPPLIWSIWAGNIPMMTTLLGAGAEVDKTDWLRIQHRRYLPVEMAVIAGSVQAVKVLTAAGAKLTTGLGQGEKSVWGLANAMSSKKIVKFLVKARHTGRKMERRECLWWQHRIYEDRKHHLDAQKWVKGLEEMAVIEEPLVQWLEWTQQREKEKRKGLKGRIMRVRKVEELVMKVQQHLRVRSRSASGSS